MSDRSFGNKRKGGLTHNVGAFGAYRGSAGVGYQSSYDGPRHVGVSILSDGPIVPRAVFDRANMTWAQVQARQNADTKATSERLAKVRKAHRLWLASQPSYGGNDAKATSTVTETKRVAVGKHPNGNTRWERYTVDVLKRTSVQEACLFDAIDSDPFITHMPVLTDMLVLDQVADKQVMKRKLVHSCRAVVYHKPIGTLPPINGHDARARARAELDALVAAWRAAKQLDYVLALTGE